MQNVYLLNIGYDCNYTEKQAKCNTFFVKK